MVAHRVLAVLILCISAIGAASVAEAQIADGSVSGHVRTTAGGVVGSVKVDLFGATADGSRGRFLGSTATGNDGSYEFSDLSAGAYVLTFIAPGDDKFTNNSRWRNVPVQVDADEAVEGVDATLIDQNDPEPANVPGQLVSFASGKCASVWGGSSDHGAVLAQWECRGAPSQRFSLQPVGQANEFRFVAEHSGKCLAVAGASQADGADVVQWPCPADDAAHFVWQLEQVGEGQRLRAKHSGRCMAVWGGSPANGARIVQWTCTSSNNMLFDLGAGEVGAGQWASPITLPLVPAAVALVDEGRLLLWSAFNKTSFGGNQGYTQTAIFDPQTGSIRERTVTETGHDFFCPAISTMADGRVIIAGGSSAGRTTIYDPGSDSWAAGGQLNTPRAYNSSAVLADGSILTIGGSWAGGVFDKGTEVYRNGAWTKLTGISALPLAGNDPAGLSLSDNHYWLFPWTDDRVFHAGPSQSMHWISTRGAGSITPVGQRASDGYAINGNAVMFEPGKILTVGGSTAYSYGQASAQAHVIDITGAEVTTTPIGSMARARAYHTSVLLPTGEVVVVGGVGGSPVTFVDAVPVMTPELFDPQTNTFTPLAPMAVPRAYHSWAILLPDARIVAGGGGLCGGCHTNHANLEILTPPYLLNDDGSLAERPQITSGPRTGAYGQSITVATDGPVDEFVLIRRSTATHSVNTDQRRVPVTSAGSSGRYTVELPTEPGIALPGEYLLFALKDGTPSVAHTIRLG